MGTLTPHRELQTEDIVSSLDFLICCNEKSKNFCFYAKTCKEEHEKLTQSVIGDEKRVYHTAPESKQQLIDWWHITSPVKVVLSC